MKINSLYNKIKKLGGTATITNKQRYDNYPVLQGELNGYDICMFGNANGECDYYTVRAIKNRGEYDMGADYNPGGYMFRYRIKDLDKVLEYENGEK